MNITSYFLLSIYSYKMYKKNAVYKTAFLFTNYFGKSILNYMQLLL